MGSIEPELLCIGGAPRSGTSLMLRMLDWHPDILMFPYEPKGLADRYFFEGPIDFSGKEYVLADRCRLDLLTEAFHALNEPHNAELMREFDTRAFAAAVSNCESYFGGLYAGLIAGSTQLRKRYSRSPRYLGVKLPFYVEASVEKLSVGRDVKFIVCDREPVARYASAKARALKGGASLRPVGQLDYATLQGVMHRVSRVLTDRAIKEGRSIIRIQYLETRFSQRDLLSICDCLGVNFHPVMLESTYFGQSQFLPSAYGFVNRADDDVSKREVEIKRIVNPVEAQYVTALAGGEAAVARDLASGVFAHDTPNDRRLREVASPEFELWLSEPDKFITLLRERRPGLI